MPQNQERYYYAAPGQRSAKVHQQQQVRYLHDVEIRTDHSRARAASRLQLVLAGNCRIYQQGNDARVHFNLCDRLSNISMVLDSLGERVSQEAWYPFGGTASWLTGSQAGAEIKFQRYAGKERDATGLIAYGWRYYAPWQMRWLNCDPAGTIDGVNLFRMVSNNPISLYDRDGRIGRWLIEALNNSEHEDMFVRLQNLQQQVCTSEPMEFTPTVSPTDTMHPETAISAPSRAQLHQPGLTELSAHHSATSLPGISGNATIKKSSITVVGNAQPLSHHNIHCIVIKVLSIGNSYTRAQKLDATKNTKQNKHLTSIKEEFMAISAIAVTGKIVNSDFLKITC